MSDEIMNVKDKEPRKSGKVAKISRGALQIAGGAIPFSGGVLSAVAGAWSEGEQEKVNRFFPGRCTGYPVHPPQIRT